jgi:hypothetical protein
MAMAGWEERISGTHEAEASASDYSQALRKGMESSVTKTEGITESKTIPTGEATAGSDLASDLGELLLPEFGTKLDAPEVREAVRALVAEFAITSMMVRARYGAFEYAFHSTAPEQGTSPLGREFRERVRTLLYGHDLAGISVRDGHIVHFSLATLPKPPARPRLSRK